MSGSASRLGARGEKREKERPLEADDEECANASKRSFARHFPGATRDTHLLLLRDEVADVGGRRRCQHHVPGTVPHRRRVRAHAGGYTLSGSPGATENVKCADGTLARADSGRSRGKTDACVSLRSLCDLFIPRTTVLSSRSNVRFYSCTRIQSANSRV